MGRRSLGSQAQAPFARDSVGRNPDACVGTRCACRIASGFLAMPRAQVRQERVAAVDADPGSAYEETTSVGIVDQACELHGGGVVPPLGQWGGHICFPRMLHLQDAWWMKVVRDAPAREGFRHGVGPGHLWRQLAFPHGDGWGVSRSAGARFAISRLGAPPGRLSGRQNYGRGGGFTFCTPIGARPEIGPADRRWSSLAQLRQDVWATSAHSRSMSATCGQLAIAGSNSATVGRRRPALA